MAAVPPSTANVAAAIRNLRERRRFIDRLQRRVVTGL
jgi:uncharacterized protein YjiS (DUF1127 family)